MLGMSRTGEGLRKFTLGFNELESTHRNSDNVSGTESQLHYTPN